MKQNYQLHKVDEAPRRASVLTLDDDDRAVLGIIGPHVEPEPGDISYAELTVRYMRRCRLSMAEAQNRAATTLAKLRPRRPQSVAVRPPETIQFGTRPQPAPIADAQPDDMGRLTAFFLRSGYDYETAQDFALRQLSDPSFNPDRTAEYASEPQRQEYANCIAELCAILQAPSAQGRAVIKALGNGNTLATLTCIANGWIMNYAVCQTWAQRVVAGMNIGGPLPYERALAQAQKLTKELADASDRTPDRLSSGVIVPAIASASANRGGYPVAGPLQAGSSPVDISAPAAAAMRETTPVEASWWRARAFADAARAKVGR